MHHSKRTNYCDPEYIFTYIHIYLLVHTINWGKKQLETYHRYKNTLIDIWECGISFFKLCNDHLIKINHFQSKPRSNNPSAHDYHLLHVLLQSWCFQMNLKSLLESYKKPRIKFFLSCTQSHPPLILVEGGCGTKQELFGKVSE